MVNPLARVVMNNVVQKTNSDSNRNIGFKENKTNINPIGLDRIVDEIRGDKSSREPNPIRNTSPILKEETNIRRDNQIKSTSNLTSKDLDLIADIINGGKNVTEEKERGATMTLDQVANRIRNR